MRAAQMIETEQQEMEDAKGNHTESNGKVVQHFRGFLEQVSHAIDKEQHAANKELSRLRLEIEVLTELAADRIISVAEASQIRVVNNDHNIVKHPQYSEWEPY